MDWLVNPYYILLAAAAEAIDLEFFCKDALLAIRYPYL